MLAGYDHTRSLEFVPFPMKLGLLLGHTTSYYNNRVGTTSVAAVRADCIVGSKLLLRFTI